MYIFDRKFYCIGVFGIMFKEFLVVMDVVEELVRVGLFGEVCFFFEVYFVLFFI